jgi:hydroxymethylglutaryl-CoA lyase
MNPTFPKTVDITEVAARDGLQLEKALIPTERKIALIKGFAAAGARRIEATSFVSPRAVPQLADAADVVTGIRGLGPIIAALAPNEKGARRAAEAGVDEIVTFVSASESHSRANLNKGIAQAIADVEGVATVARETGKILRSAIAVAFGCPFEGDVSPEAVSAIAGSLKALGIRSLTLGDTTGMASPPHVEALCRRLLEDHPDIELTLHFHDTRGLALLNVLAGLRQGSRATSLRQVGLEDARSLPARPGMCAPRILSTCSPSLAWRPGSTSTRLSTPHSRWSGPLDASFPAD